MTAVALFVIGVLAAALAISIIHLARQLRTEPTDPATDRTRP